ncbi:hypothetical protein LTR37_016670 [Vermiconidia calcicola]|uniref:Uncharacterized protein n=1 Tax=Vermiconidia calcicola TaxID=1690605 RepID=A0ACC3MMJ6_9PEZI|nr:hypothetical protein LTR37_016670 [Vermiconidia calcicola]
MVAIGQTITIVNKSGKVVGTSKHLVNVFNEAKSAYSERKAELKASRRDQADRKSDERKALKQLEALKVEDDDTVSRRSSRRGSEDGKSTRRKPVPERRRERPPIERGVSDSFYANDSAMSRRSSHRPSPLRRQSEAEPRMNELTRRHTGGLEIERHSRAPLSPRRASADDIDMDLAYGELPPPLPERKYDTEIELRQKMSGLQLLLDECNCLQYSVTAMIDNLQKNPDALAAVALTLAEISNLASKMAPGALMTMKGSFPAIIALLASPQFAIAAGVGVGVTIIALGSYKIIKKIKARKEAEEAGLLLEDGHAYGDEPDSPESEMDSLRELNRIEMWRRGIVEEEASSMGTSVDGEFVTPAATRTLIEEGTLTEKDFKAKEKKEKKRRHKSSKSEVSSTSEKVKVKSKKESGGIRMLFKGHSTKGTDA